jgi:hypothetical protein
MYLERLACLAFCLFHEFVHMCALRIWMLPQLPRDGVFRRHDGREYTYPALSVQMCSIVKVQKQRAACLKRRGLQCIPAVVCAYRNSW